MKSDQTKVVALQAWWRGEMTRSRIRKLVKSLTKRKYIIRELVETQEKYIRDLSIVISDFKGSLIKKKIITNQQSHTLFSNIDEIRQLNQLFFASIFTQSEHYTHYKIIFANAQKEIPFFKIYFQYFNNFNQSNSLVNSLSENNHDFNRFFSQARANPKYHQLTLKDFLIKPVQRLPKYVLIMREVKKLTPSWHPDLKNIENVLQTFQDVNNSNNDKLNQVVNSYKIGEIERNLILPHNLSEPGVQFVLQESVSVLSMDGQVREGTLYLLSTQLIVARRSEKDKEKVLSCVPFKHGGQIMENQQHFYYKNSFTIQNGEGDSCTFIFESQQQKDLLLQKIYSQLMKAQQKNLQKLASLYHSKSPASVQFLRKMNRMDLLPQIQVLGTEERNDSMFKYTVYIVEVKIKSIRQKLFLRFSELLSLQEVAMERGLNIKNQLMKTTWLLNHKPKKIEERKMNIQRFLKELLSKQEVVENGGAVLEALGLPQSFYHLPEQFRQGQEIMKKSTISQRSTGSQEDHSHRSPNNHSLVNHRGSVIRHSKRSSIFNSIPELMVQPPHNHQNRHRQISIQDILQANEINLGHFTRLSEALYRSSQKQQTLQFNVLIPWIQNQKGFVRQRVRIPQSQKVYFLIERVASQINLKYYKDFRLYLERDYANRLLDDDQCLSKIAEEIKYGKYLLILKKMIYLTPEIEERETRADRVRLQIIASQAIYDCKKDKYLLSYRTVLRLSALVGLSQLFKEVSPSLLPPQLSLDQIQHRNLASKTREMVTNSFTSFYDSPSTWQHDYERMISHLYTKLRGICRQNSHIFRTSQIKDEEQEFNTTNLAQLASVSIVNQIKDNAFYGSLSFIVQISEEFRHILQVIHKEEEGDLQNRNCWLVIKYHQIYLFSISLKEELFAISYDDILKMVAYPAAIELRLRAKEVDYIKLKTTCSYSIRELILYYKQYNEMIRKMEEDDDFEQSILEFVREYNHTTLEHSFHKKTLVQ